MKRTRFAMVLLGLFLFCLPTVFAQSGFPKTLVPAEKMGEQWWRERHEANCARIAQGNVDFLMIGDSITHYWENSPEVLNYYYGDRNYVDMGFGGDQVQHVLWRLNNAPMDKIHPKAAMLLIGVNNLWGSWDNCTEYVALGVKACVDKLKALYPDIKILVLNIFPALELPNEEVRWRAAKTNAFVIDLLQDYPNVTVKNIDYIWVDKEGKIPKELMDDFVHPTDKGYKLWGAAVEPIISEMLGVPAKPAME